MIATVCLLAQSSDQLTTHSGHILILPSRELAGHRKDVVSMYETDVSPFIHGEVPEQGIRLEKDDEAFSDLMRGFMTE